MDSLELYNLSVESLLLTIAKKYISQNNLVSTMLVIQTFAVIGIISKIGVDLPVF